MHLQPCLGIFVVVGSHGHGHHLVDGVHAPVRFGTEIDNLPHARQLVAAQLSEGLRLQFRQHLVGHLHEIIVLVVVANAQHLHVRPQAQVLHLVLLEVGVHRDGHGSQLGASHEHGGPVGNVGSPDAHMSALLHAYGHQSLGEFVHATVEISVSPPQVAVRINDVFLVRVILGPILEPLTDCPFR